MSSKEYEERVVEGKLVEIIDIPKPKSDLTDLNPLPEPALSLDEMFTRQDGVRLRIKNLMVYLDKALPEGERKSTAMYYLNESLVCSVQALMDGTRKG